MELHVAISRCLKRKIPVIPVLLPGVQGISEQLLFLSEYNRVRFERVDDEDAWARLIWGISGVRPSRPKRELRP